jgi:hypothetical protein
MTGHSAILEYFRGGKMFLQKQSKWLAINEMGITVEAKSWRAFRSTSLSTCDEVY